MPTIRGVLRAIAADGTATVQLVGSGNLATYVDGISISKAVLPGLLAPGADVWVEVADRYRPSDGQVVALAAVAAASTANDGSEQTTQAGTATVLTDVSGNGAVAVTFAAAFSAPPAVTVATSQSQLGTGKATATAVTAVGFTITIAAAWAQNADISVSWSAVGS
jgi:hypothetical protein